jgi:hypothetical protein
VISSNLTKVCRYVASGSDRRLRTLDPTRYVSNVDPDPIARKRGHELHSLLESDLPVVLAFRPTSAATDRVCRKIVQSGLVRSSEGVTPCMIWLDPRIGDHVSDHFTDATVNTVGRSCRCAVLPDIAEQVTGFRLPPALVGSADTRAFKQRLELVRLGTPSRV